MRDKDLATTSFPQSHQLWVRRKASGEWVSSPLPPLIQGQDANAG